MLLYFADLNAAPVQQPGVDVSLPNDEGMLPINSLVLAKKVGPE